MCVNVLPSGRLVLPARLRKELGVDKGGQRVARLVDGEVRLTTPDRALDEARTIFRRYVPAGTAVVGEVIAERRAESEREERDAKASNDA